MQRCHRVHILEQVDLPELWEAFLKSPCKAAETVGPLDTNSGGMWKKAPSRARWKSHRGHHDSPGDHPSPFDARGTNHANVRTAGTGSLLPKNHQEQRRRRRERTIDIPSWIYAKCENVHILRECRVPLGNDVQDPTATTCAVKVNAQKHERSFLRKTSGTATKKQRSCTKVLLDSRTVPMHSEGTAHQNSPHNTDSASVRHGNSR